MNSNNIQTMKDFCEDQGELQTLCEKFNCNKNTVLYTKEQADYLSEIYPPFKEGREKLNKKGIEV